MEKYKILNKKERINLYNLEEDSNIYKNKTQIFVIGLLIFLALIVAVPFVQANFVCGQVNDAPDNNSAAWYNVHIYYSDLRNNYSSCDISPDENKFCCDAENISGRAFKVGQMIYSEVYDNETGYVAGPVSLVSTSEGYDVFPVMNLLKVINIYSPKNRLILSNLSSILFNSSFLSPYNLVQIDNNGNKTTLCDNCSSFANKTSFNFGMNYPKIIASNGSRVFSENMNFAILKSFLFKMDIACDGCKKKSVPWSKNINMNINVNLSDNVIGMELREYVPVDFDILNSDGGEVKPYSSTHDVIVWNVSGTNINKNFIVKSPGMKIFNTQYVFKSEIEGLNLSTDNVIVRGILPIFSIKEKSLFESIKKRKYPKVGPNMALVLNLKLGNIMQVAVFPNKKIKNAEFELKSYKYKGELENVIEYYIFDTNMKVDNINKLYIKFRLDKKMLKNNGYKNASLYILNDSQWEKANLSLFRQDKLTNYYEAYTNPANGFAIVGEK